jgi:hypothetical protein
VPFFHVDQRPVRERCLAVLAKVPPARVELLPILEECRLVFGASPAGIGGLLLNRQVRGDHAGCRRIVERAIPVRGAVRPERVGAAVVVIALAGAGLWWFAPALALVTAVVALGVAAGWYVRQHAPAYAMARMEHAAREAAEMGSGTMLSAILGDVHRMIAEDRIPAGTGFRLVAVLRAAVDADPFPVDLLRDLRRLLFLAPEVDIFHGDAERAVERDLQLRTGALVSRFREARRAGGDGSTPRAELRQLARTGPSAIHARGSYAQVLAILTADAPLLDEIEELLGWIAGVDDAHARTRDGAPATLAAALEDVAARSSDMATVDRARALRARVGELMAAPPRAPHRRVISPPVFSPPPVRGLVRGLLDRARRRGTRQIAELHAAVATASASEETRRRVLAIYRRLRDAVAQRADDGSVTNLITAMRLAAMWSGPAGDAAILREIYDDTRVLLGRGRIPSGSGAALAGVLRECAAVEPFPMMILADFDALRTLAPEVEPALHWSIVDAAILRLDARLKKLATGTAEGRAALDEIAAVLEQIAAESVDPGMVERARALGARAASAAS